MTAGATPALAAIALRGCCPRCGKASMFAGVIAFAPRCRVCGLDFAAFNVGDGAASFLILIVGAIVTGLAIWVELAFEPPWWLHVLLWLPLTIALTLALLRVSKALLLALEFRNNAGEGHL
ncbi:hypothetical protein IP88_09275 [alpha proteobacterium AAP81b]|nr:hypothetical protein IP88_09275 [alpha proteobacterium AAP81b]